MPLIKINHLNIYLNRYSSNTLKSSLYIIKELSFLKQRNIKHEELLPTEDQ